MADKYSNGDAVLPICIFCRETFEEPAVLGEKIECECGNTYKISMYGKSIVSPKGE